MQVSTLVSKAFFFLIGALSCDLKYYNLKTIILVFSFYFITKVPKPMNKISPTSSSQPFLEILENFNNSSSEFDQAKKNYLKFIL